MTRPLEMKGLEPGDPLPEEGLGWADRSWLSPKPRRVSLGTA